MPNQSIDHQTYSYKKGLILGLTMAEIMLLLVFCLLLMLGAITNRLEKELAASRAELQALKPDNIRSKLIEKLVDDFNSKNTDLNEYWMELVRAKELAKKLSKYNKLPDQLVSEIDKLLELEKLVEKYGSLDDVKAALDRLATNASSNKSNDKPPHIVLSEADGFFFDSGRAEIKQEFARKLKQTIIPQIVQAMKTYDVDIVEVIGHTDSQPVGGHSSNLDSVFPSVIRGEKPIGGARSSDNAGLGLMRAVAVVRALIEDPSTKRFRILPFSAGQLIDTNEKLLIEEPSRGVDARRRIEIRLRKSLKERSIPN